VKAAMGGAQPYVATSAAFLVMYGLSVSPLGTKPQMTEETYT
jgi:hypothetical protein